MFYAILCVVNILINNEQRFASSLVRSCIFSGPVAFSNSSSVSRAGIWNAAACQAVSTACPAQQSEVSVTPSPSLTATSSSSNSS